MSDFIVSMRDDIGNRNFTVTIDGLDNHEAMRRAANQIAASHDVDPVQLRCTGCQQIDDEVTPVIFRAERSGDFKGDVTAVFPCEPGTSDRHTMSCYAHVGQHSGCTMGWYMDTRAATPEEYADLKKELESAPYGYRLKVYSRMQRTFHDVRSDALRKMRAAR